MSDITECFRCGGSGRAHPDGKCDHCRGTGKLTWLGYGRSAPGDWTADIATTPTYVMIEPTVKAKLCPEDEERLDRLEALMTKIAEKLEIQP